MPRLRAFKAALAGAIALGSLAAVSSAGAAGWQGPATISETTVNADGSPTIALGRSGDAAAAWWDDLSGGRIALARKRAGAAWSAPVAVAAPVSATPLFPALDGSGTITLAYTSGGVTTVASMAPGAAAPTLTPLPGAGLVLGGLAVNAAGDAVLAGWSGSPAELTVGYRHGPGGTFALKTYSYSDILYGVSSARVAINAAGTAVVVFSAHTLRAVTRSASGDWPATPETVTSATVSGDPAVGIDDAGRVLAAFTYGSPIMVLRTALRTAPGSWVESSDLSPATAGSAATSLTLAVNASGAAALVWLQGATGPVSSVKARYGSTGSGVFGATEDVNDTGATAPAAAIGDDGSVVAVWERMTTGGNNIGQARVRSGGAAGTWGDIRTVSAPHANGTTPALAGDGPGDFATVSTPYDGTYHPVILSFYDAAAPTVSKPSVTGSPFPGNPIALGATAADAWSTVASATWTFGDGGTATGLMTTHTYAAAGTYTAHLSVVDALGNTGGTDVAVVVATAQAKLTSARFTATWKQSRVHGTLRLEGSAPLAGSYVFDVSKGKTRRLHIALKLRAGAFSRDLKLPSTLVPGSYRIAVVPGDSIVKGTTRSAKLSAPVEGVADSVRLVRTRTALTARFHLAALPRTGKLTLTWYRAAGGGRVRLLSAGKGRGATVAGSLPLLGRRGTFTAVLARAGKVIAQKSVTIA